MKHTVVIPFQSEFGNIQAFIFTGTSRAEDGSLWDTRVW